MAVSGHRWRVAFIVVLPAIALVFLLFRGPMAQSDVLPDYHNFADHRTLWGVPNFWNVVSNLPFLLAAIWGLRALRSRSAFVEEWERIAYCILLASVALVALGSGYYHAWPEDATLFWDRLPMAVMSMALLATTIGERISGRAGRLLLFPPRYSATAGIAIMIALCGLALAFDRSDRLVAAITPMGGHPWKHFTGAAAMLAYVSAIAGRRPLPARQLNSRVPAGSS